MAWEISGYSKNRVKDLMVQQGMVKALMGQKPEGIKNSNWKEMLAKTIATIHICLADEILHHVMDEDSLAKDLLKLESRYMLKSLNVQVYLKQKFYDKRMVKDSDLV